MELQIDTVTRLHLYPSTMPVENWPVMLVKGEVDPGIIEGIVRYGAWNQALYNLPIQLPGRVRAVGIADDPYTGASTGRAVEARGYFNATAKGHYEIEGVAPGVYDIYASAAGYPEMKVASGVKIIAGKSFHLDFLLQPGPIITGVLYSKHSFGEVPWPSTRPVTVEIYDSNEWPAAKPGYDWDSAGMAFEAQHLKSFSPINLTDSPYTSYVTGNVIYDPATGYALTVKLTTVTYQSKLHSHGKVHNTIRSNTSASNMGQWHQLMSTYRSWSEDTTTDKDTSACSTVSAQHNTGGLTQRVMDEWWWIQ